MVGYKCFFQVINDKTECSSMLGSSIYSILKMEIANAIFTKNIYSMLLYAFFESPITQSLSRIKISSMALVQLWHHD